MHATGREKAGALFHFPVSLLSPGQGHLILAALKHIERFILELLGLWLT